MTGVQTCALPISWMTATDVGYVDEVVLPEQLEARALEAAVALAELPATAYAQNKRDSRRSYIDTIAASLT